MNKIIYNKCLGEIWLWMIFLEWIYFIMFNSNSIYERASPDNKAHF